MDGTYLNYIGEGQLHYIDGNMTCGERIHIDIPRGSPNLEKVGANLLTILVIYIDGYTNRHLL